MTLKARNEVQRVTGVTLGDNGRPIIHCSGRIRTATTGCRTSTRTPVATSTSISTTSRTIGIRTMSSSASATHLFLLYLYGQGSFFLQSFLNIFLPTSKHSTYLIKVKNKTAILLMINNFVLPCYLKEKF